MGAFVSIPLSDCHSVDGSDFHVARGRDATAAIWQNLRRITAGSTLSRP